jgi:hypothetical protein
LARMLGLRMLGLNPGMKVSAELAVGKSPEAAPRAAHNKPGAVRSWTSQRRHRHP